MLFNKVHFQMWFSAFCRTVNYFVSPLVHSAATDAWARLVLAGSWPATLTFLLKFLARAAIVFARRGCMLSTRTHANIFLFPAYVTKMFSFWQVRSAARMTNSDFPRM